MKLLKTVETMVESPAKFFLSLGLKYWVVQLCGADARDHNFADSAMLEDVLPPAVGTNPKSSR